MARITTDKIVEQWGYCACGMCDAVFQTLTPVVDDYGNQLTDPEWGYPLYTQDDEQRQQDSDDIWDHIATVHGE